MKRNKRYGIVFPGHKTERQLHVVVCVDTSGSVSDYELGQFWGELVSMSKNKVKITVIEADADVKNVYEFEPKTKPSFVGRGGTAAIPAINKAKTFDPDVIMYMTDGDYFDKPENPKIPFMWVLVRADKVNADFGKVIKIPGKI